MMATKQTNTAKSSKGGEGEGYTREGRGPATATIAEQLAKKLAEHGDGAAKLGGGNPRGSGNGAAKPAPVLGLAFKAPPKISDITAQKLVSKETLDTYRIMRGDHDNDEGGEEASNRSIP